MSSVPDNSAGDGYRADIDGLRALAVLPVVLFHFNVALFAGGYVGVDVFFVISGYLITRIIHREISSGGFSILAFYERRARRILPALFATIAVTGILGAAILMPDELRDLGASMIGVATFSSNILFWQQADYFAGPAEFKPLLHTWSLAVEEQFYIVFPVFLALLARFHRARFFWPTLIVALASFVLSVVALHVDPSGNYYLLPTRAWELMAGSLLAYRRGAPRLSRLQREGGAALGVALILASALLLTEESPFPGYNALWPCLGAILIIGTGHASLPPTFVARLLGSAPLRGIGLISYSLYLVHWPLFVFVKYQLLRDPTPSEQIAMCVAALILAWVSWRFVERPFRSRQRVSRPVVFAGATFLGVLTCATGAAAFKYDGFPGRFGFAIEVAADQADTADGPRCFLKDGWQDWSGEACHLSRGAGGNILLWGDSHANHYRAAIIGAAPPLGTNVLLYASAGCLPVFGYALPHRPYCPGNAEHVVEIIRDHRIDTVVMAGYWWRALRSGNLTYEMIEDTIARLRALGVEVKMIGDNPDFPFANPQFLAYRLSDSAEAEAAYYLPVRNDREVNARLASLLPAGAFFDPMQVLCREKECLAYDRGQIIMTDNAHFSRYGSGLVLENMRSFLRPRVD
jgi:peptidoglycan/LPS O-acetylase OafA/YrhL